MRLLVSYALISNKSLTYRILQNVKKKRAPSIRQRFTIASPTDEPETKSLRRDEFYHFLRPDRMSVYIVDYETSMNEMKAHASGVLLLDSAFQAKIGPIALYSSRSIVLRSRSSVRGGMMTSLL